MGPGGPARLHNLAPAGSIPAPALLMKAAENFVDSLKDILLANTDATPGKLAKESHNFPGHEMRMAAHIQRVRNHPCERTDGRKCPDCVKGTP